MARPILRPLLAAALLLAPLPAAAFELQIIHASDNESAFVDPVTLEPKILHYAAIAAGLKRVAPEGGRNSIYITAGDHTLPAPFYRAAADAPSLGARGLGDIAVYNAMGLAATAMGNHEFDGGINDFARMIARANYPFIAVNLDFSQVRLAEGVPAIRRGQDGGSVTENAGKVVRSAYVEVGGERIGLVARAPADFFNVVMNPDSTLPGLDFVGGRDRANNQPRVSALGQVQEQVALLERQGINKIILLDHAQDYTADPLAAKDLSGVDIVITAGSTGFIARDRADGPYNMLRPGDRPTGEYPIRRADRDGNPVMVVNSDQLYNYVGHMIVRFDARGHVEAVDPRSGPIATTAEAAAALSRAIGAPVEPPAEVKAVFDALTATPVIRQMMSVIGRTTQPLNGDRGAARTRETNLGRVTADATLWYARSQGVAADLAIKNGGGIRSSIPAPQMTGFTVAAALAFDNKMTAIEMTAAELLAAFENSVSRVPAADGRFPQLAGATLVFDPARPGQSDLTESTTPSRVVALTVTRADGNVDVVVRDGAMQGDPARRFIVLTNDFMATGGDGYRALAAAAQTPGRFVRATGIGEQRIVADYVAGPLGGTVDMADPPPDSRVRRVP